MALKDLSRPRFGYCLPIFANPTAGLFRTPNYDAVDARTTLDLGIHAEQIGFDSLWVADHLMLGRDEAILEGWTMLSALAGTTRTSLLGMIHQAHYFRSPALAAKMAATLDQLSGGRLIMFYDFGRQAREHHAYHLPYPDDVDVRVRETVEGLTLICDLWANGRGSGSVPLTAAHGMYGVTEATCTPVPAQETVPIWFGEVEEGLLDACARFGHGWNTTPCGLEELGRRLDLLRAACDRAGRDFHEIEVSVEMQVLIAESDEAVRATLRGLLAKVPDPERIDPALQAYADGAADVLPESFTQGTFIGTPEQVGAQIQAYIDAGTDHFMFWFLDAPERGGMELAAREVFPAFA